MEATQTHTQSQFQFQTGKIPVDALGTELFYVDSGPPVPDSNYTTVILIHGSGINGKIFEHLVPFAQASSSSNSNHGNHGLRLIIPNRRDYTFSTPYTDSELEDLKAGKEEALQRTGKEMVEVCKYLIERKMVCKITDDGEGKGKGGGKTGGKKGGIVFLGWSMGNATVLSLFGWPEAVPSQGGNGKEDLELLDAYVRRMILWGEFEIPEEMASNFGEWVTDYWDHPDLSLREASSACLEYTTKRPKNSRPSIRNLVVEDPNPNSTTLPGSGLPRSDIFEPAAQGRSEMPMYFEPMQGTIKKQAYKALWNPDPEGGFVLPKVDVVWLTGTKAPWYCVWGWEIDGANHLAQWDEPEKFWSALVDAVMY
ncbi:hypothetical protein D9758_014555 [Tetrapyrgos nigripes]|uniref:AB hydrolase-1 domain-containing protein n=1 Tax=Tetrapyrgos nigripes TaxID=182062 RepID=A0A8H5CEW7_9AGAR|nr:hypothetical protein D9758_014555 [Tetrapyrgos nigripes]